MVLCNSPDIFQEKMNEFFTGFKNVRTYIDDLLILGKSSWEEHVNQLDKVLNKLKSAGLKVNVSKSFFGKSELEYLGFIITRKGIKPTPKKVHAITNIAVPKNKKEVRSFIGLINYYRDMWSKRSEIITPLTMLTSKNAKWE